MKNLLIIQIENGIEQFSAEDLEELSLIVRSEKDRRDDEKISSGNFDPLNHDELVLLATNKLEAIKVYRNRTGESLNFSNRLFDTYLPRGV